MSARGDRLGRLPFTSEHRRLLLGSGVGWALDAMDIGLVSFIMAALAKEWALDRASLSLLGAVGFVGMAIGASFGGWLADRIGRRTVFALTLVVYGVATGLSALAPGLMLLILLRFVVGLGLGAELPVASTLVSEFAPTRIRGRVVVALESFWAVGWLAAALIGRFIVPGPDGWRWALAIGALPALYALLVRFGLPESVHFLEAKGREAEAEAVVRRFEQAAGQPAANPPAPTAPAAAPEGWTALFSGAFGLRTAALSAAWFGMNFAYYGAFIWLPTLLSQQGMSLVKSFEFTLWLTLAQLPGYLAAAILIERIGRRATLVSFLAGSAVGAVAFGAASPEWVLPAGLLMSFFNLGAWGALYVLTPEVFPTALRGSGAGFAAGIGRVAAILAPLSVPALLAIGGTTAVFFVFGAAFLLAALASLALPERTGAALDLGWLKIVHPPPRCRIWNTERGSIFCFA